MTKKRHLAVGVAVAMMLCGGTVLAWYRYQWRAIWEQTAFRRPYAVAAHDDDTLRVLMIGDSWAQMHQENGCDTMLSRMIHEQTGGPVKVASKGRGGAVSKAVYHLMYGETAAADSACCMEQMLKGGADYCIVIAGINDAVANLGPAFYVRHYDLILRTLQAWNMRPVVIEVPDVGIYDMYSRKDWKDLALDRLRAWMTGAAMYDVGLYRQALHNRLLQAGDSIVYVPHEQWDGERGRDRSRLYLSDQIHLNRQGYHALDSCIAVCIARDYLSDTDSLKKAMGGQSQQGAADNE